MKTSIILFEPLYEENIGLVSRAMKNFSCKDLFLVNPKCNYLSDKTKSRAMHAQLLLRKAKEVKSIRSIRKHFDLIVGTTARLSKEKKHYRKALTLKNFKELYITSNLNIGIVFGREDKGLPNKILNELDLIVSIPSNKKYSSLNISHAVAITLYELYYSRKKIFHSASNKTRNILFKKTEKLISSLNSLKNKKAVNYAFKQLINKTNATEKELKSVIAFFSSILKKQ